MSPGMHRALVHGIKKWRMEWAVGTVLLYAVAIPFTVIVFPANTLWLALVILFTGLLGALTALADLLVNADTHEEVSDGPE